MLKLRDLRTIERERGRERERERERERKKKKHPDTLQDSNLQPLEYK